MYTDICTNWENLPADAEKPTTGAGAEIVFFLYLAMEEVKQRSRACEQYKGDNFSRCCASCSTLTCRLQKKSI